MGFTATGIAAGSFAASMMSSAAIANGGAVAAGSLVAVLQSAGEKHTHFHIISCYLLLLSQISIRAKLKRPNIVLGRRN